MYSNVFVNPPSFFCSFFSFLIFYSYLKVIIVQIYNVVYPSGTGTCHWCLLFNERIPAVCRRPHSIWYRTHRSCQIEKLADLIYCKPLLTQSETMGLSDVILASWLRYFCMGIICSMVAPRQPYASDLFFPRGPYSYSRTS